MIFAVFDVLLTTVEFLTIHCSDALPLAETSFWGLVAVVRFIYLF